MFARISFDSSQKITNEELENLRIFLSDEIEHEQLYVKLNDSDNSTTKFYSWSHTLDPLDLEKEGNEKVLVKELNLVELDYHKEYLTNLDSFFTKFPTLKVKVRGIPQGSSEINIFSGIISQMNDIQNKLETALKSFDKSLEFNQKCDVHVSNLGLLHINQLGYALDKCTQELQDILNQGWRIIAACVQPDQRRPDYILGRYNPESDNCEWVEF